MYILEIPNKRQREEVLLAIVNAIYEKTFETLEHPHTNSGYGYLANSQTTKTEKIGIKDITIFKKSISLTNDDYPRLGIINNAHNLTVEAQNAMLKDLEEEPENTIIILAVSDKRLLLPTILSRGIAVTSRDIYILHANLNREGNKEKIHKILYNREDQDKDLSYIAEFLHSSLYDNLLYASAYVEKKKSSNTQKESPEEGKEVTVESFLIDLLSYYESLTIQEGNAEYLPLMQLVEQGLKKIKKGVNANAVLEYIILAIHNERHTNI